MSVPPVHVQSSSIPLGIGYILMAVSLFGIMDALVKWLAASYPTVQIMFFRSLCAFPPILVMVLHSAGSLPNAVQLLKTRRPFGHGLRSLCGCSAMLLFFYSYQFLPLAEVTAIAFAAPIFIACLSVWLLQERVGLHRWSAIVVGFVGMLVIIRPGAGTMETAALIVVGATALYSLSIIQIRRLSRSEPAGTIAFWFSGFCAVLTGLALPFFWVTPSWSDLLLLVATGLIGGLAQLFMTRAYGLAPAAVVAPFDYTHLLWSVGIGWYVWGDFPDVQTWIGCAIVIASGLYILYRETVKRAPVPAIVTE
jgi:drug/metabolite transporter (DMT)-like permease